MMDGLWCLPIIGDKDTIRVVVVDIVFVMGEGCFGSRYR